jgi:hypothetical protein
MGRRLCRGPFPRHYQFPGLQRGKGFFYILALDPRHVRELSGAYSAALMRASSEQLRESRKDSEFSFTEGRSEVSNQAIGAAKLSLLGCFFRFR